MVPPSVERWVARARWLRWLDATAAVLAVWPLVALVLDAPADAAAVLAVAVVALAAVVPSLRHRWRPVSALVSLSTSRGVRPGDVAWCIFDGRAERVIVTARRRLRLVVARPDQGPAEGVEIRRTRVPIVSAR
jgi:hypothetical protein